MVESGAKTCHNSGRVMAGSGVYRYFIVIPGAPDDSFTFILVFSAPTVGSVAPDFTLPSNTGKDISLKDLLKKAKHTVLYFYPGQSRHACFSFAPHQ